MFFTTDNDDIFRTKKTCTNIYFVDIVRPPLQ